MFIGSAFSGKVNVKPINLSSIESAEIMEELLPGKIKRTRSYSGSKIKKDEFKPINYSEEDSEEYDSDGDTYIEESIGLSSPQSPKTPLPVQNSVNKPRRYSIGLLNLRDEVKKDNDKKLERNLEEELEEDLEEDLEEELISEYDKNNFYENILRNILILIENKYNGILETARLNLNVMKLEINDLIIVMCNNLPLILIQIESDKINLREGNNGIIVIPNLKNQESLINVLNFVDKCITNKIQKNLKIYNTKN